MSVPEYKDGALVAVFDFECPVCLHKWNNTGDPLGQEEESEEDCPSCDAELIITACWSVDYDIAVREKKP